MTADAFVQCRVSLAAKAALRASAQRQQLTESALLMRLLETALQIDARPQRAVTGRDQAVPRNSRTTVRLQPDDQLLLMERAAARRLPASTYVSVLLRAHLRHLAPLPKEELQALKRSVAELSALGRLLNQIAKATHQGGALTGPTRDHVGVMLKVCTALRDHVAALLQANATSWAAGYPNEHV